MHQHSPRKKNQFFHSFRRSEHLLTPLYAAGQKCNISLSDLKNKTIRHAEKAIFPKKKKKGVKNYI